MYKIRRFNDVNIHTTVTSIRELFILWDQILIVFFQALSLTKNLDLFLDYLRAQTAIKIQLCNLCNREISKTNTTTKISCNTKTSSAENVTKSCDESSDGWKNVEYILYNSTV